MRRRRRWVEGDDIDDDDDGDAGPARDTDRHIDAERTPRVNWRVSRGPTFRAAAAAAAAAAAVAAADARTSALSCCDSAAAGRRRDGSRHRRRRSGGLTQRQSPCSRHGGGVRGRDRARHAGEAEEAEETLRQQAPDDLVIGCTVATATATRPARPPADEGGARRGDHSTSTTLIRVIFPLGSRSAAPASSVA
jgi:hypothetical protein